MTTASTKITKADVANMSLNDILGVPMPTSKSKSKATQGPKVPRVVLTAEEQKAKRNEAQRLLRSTPEGKAYANEASKRSIAAKKARIAAELEALKAQVAVLAAVPVVDEEPVITEEPVAEVKKAAKKPSKKAVKAALVEDAPF